MAESTWLTLPETKQFPVMLGSSERQVRLGSATLFRVPSHTGCGPNPGRDAVGTREQDEYSVETMVLIADFSLDF